MHHLHRTSTTPTLSLESSLIGVTASAIQTTIFSTGEHQKAPSRPRFLDKGEHCTKESTKKHALGTKEKTKKYNIEHDFWHKEESIKRHDFWHEGEHQKARSRARLLAGGKIPKSTVLCTKENIQNNLCPTLFPKQL